MSENTEAGLALDALSGRVARQGSSRMFDDSEARVWIWDGRFGHYYSLSGEPLRGSVNTPETFEYSQMDWTIIPVPDWFTAHPPFPK